MADIIGELAVLLKADATGLGQDIERKAQGEAKKSGSKIGALLGTGLKVGAGAAAAGIGVVLSTAFVKGFSRLSSIDSAKAKLQGLGITGKELSGVMDNALNSVKGTAFGLDEAVSAVPGLLAAGVKPGKDLEQALKNMASAATLGGTSFAEVADVFGDAAAAGVATTDTFNRLEARGIPAMSNIAKSLGVTREEAKKMASSGQISFKQLQDSLTQSIGPAALAAGGSFQGMLANIMAALGRFGAEILGPVFEGLKTIMPSVIAAFDELTKVMKPIMAEVGPKVADAFSKIKDVLDGIDWAGVAETIGKIVKVFIDWAPAIWLVIGALVAFKVIQGVNAAIALMSRAIKGVQVAMAAYRAGLALSTAISAGLEAANFAMAASVWASTVAFLASPVTWIVIGIIALIAAIVLLVLNWDKVTKFLTDTWATFIEWFKGVMDAFLGWWEPIWESITKFVSEAIDNVVKWVQDNWGLLLSILIGPIGLAIQWIVENWAAISQVFIDVWNNIVAFLQPAIDVIANIFRVLGETLANIWLVIRAIAKVTWDAIVAVFMWAWTTIVAFVTPIINALVSFFTTVFTELSNFFRDIWNGIKAIIVPIIAFIVQSITAGLGVIKGIWQTVWGAISAFFTAIWNRIMAFLVPIINRIRTVIAVALGIIKGVWSSVWGAVSGVFKSIWSGIKGALDTAISGIMTVFNTLKDKILAPLAGAATWLYNVGRDIIEGMINGVKDMVGNLKSAISDTVNGVIDWAKGILGEASPSKVFDAIGVNLGKGFVNGIDSMAGQVQDAVGAMSTGAVNIAAASVPTIAAGQQAGLSGNATTNNNLNVAPGAFALSGPDPYRVSKLVVDRLAERVAA